MKCHKNTTAPTMGTPTPINHHLLTPATQAITTKMNRYTITMPQSPDSTASDPANLPDWT